MVAGKLFLLFLHIYLEGNGQAITFALPIKKRAAIKAEKFFESSPIALMTRSGVAGDGVLRR